MRSAWLDSIGLAQYADAFETNDLDIDLLRQVDDQLLKDIGGRARPWAAHCNAIANWCAGSKRDADAAPVAAGAATAERRQVTVMFSDLVGSTALSPLDPEDLRKVISAYQKSLRSPRFRFSGFAAKYMGDGVLVYFGCPQAHEVDAERACVRGWI